MEQMEEKTCRHCGTPLTHKHQREFCSHRCSDANRTRSEADRFWPKVNKTHESGCWLWTASQRPKGYGQFTDAAGRNVPSHRWAYLSVHGSIAPGLMVCHHCDTSLCVNPAHLYAGTHLQNVADREARNRRRDRLGEKNNLAKLTEDNVLEIRTSTEPSSVLAKRFGVAPSTIVSARLRVSWKHVGGPTWERQIIDQASTSASTS